MPIKSWRGFFSYIGRVFILLLILAVLLPKVAAVCNIWVSSLLHSEQKPSGNPMRVETPDWSKTVIQLFPSAKDDSRNNQTQK